MPVMTFEGGPMDTAMKKDLIEQLTAKASEITGVPAQHFTLLIREQPLENMGVGGESVAVLKARMSKEGDK